MPPWINLEERLLVPEARSPRSRRSTRSPRRAASLATAAPWMPPPTTRRSYVTLRPSPLPPRAAGPLRRAILGERLDHLQRVRYARRLSAHFGGTMTDLKGRWALVTGATSGFGLATARALAAQGCHVAITGRRDDRLQAVANEIRDRHRVDALALRFDVRELSQVRSSLEGARGLLSKLDILVNNAGLALALDPIQTGDPAD